MCTLFLPVQDHLRTSLTVAKIESAAEIVPLAWLYIDWPVACVTTMDLGFACNDMLQPDTVHDLECLLNLHGHGMTKSSMYSMQSYGTQPKAISFAVQCESKSSSECVTEDLIDVS